MVAIRGIALYSLAHTHWTEWDTRTIDPPARSDLCPQAHLGKAPNLIPSSGLLPPNSLIPPNPPRASLPRSPRGMVQGSTGHP
eukprot:scaffold2642_cov101-Isochrysis_galbana.AAC.1